MEIEKRAGLPLEIRAADTGVIRVSGYAAVFNQPTNIGDMFVEVVAPGAFRNAIQRGDDVEFLINHGGLPIARSTAGNLTLSEDEIGLRIDAELDPSDPDVARIVPKMKRAGQLDQMSFAFQIPQGGQEWEEPTNGLPVRTIRDVILHDVSIVNRGAYPTTSIALRSLDEIRKEARERAEHNRRRAEARIAQRKAEAEQKFRKLG